ncbi:MAG TPA: copper chaperone PCu(A)C [Casimicrobiaceae bacterium]
MKFAAGISCIGAAALLAWLPSAGTAQEYRLDPFLIERPIARATVPGAKSGAVFFTISNAGSTTDRLVRASVPVAAGVALHQMAVDEGMMKMRAVPSIELRPGARLELKPGGYHLMLLDLKGPLKAGEKFPVTLTFERAGGVTVPVQVEALGAMPGAK